MDKALSDLAEIVKRDPSTISKASLYEQLHKAAGRVRREGQSQQQAFAKLITDGAEGSALYTIYAAKSGPGYFERQR
jgi:hypothetical protein